MSCSSNICDTIEISSNFTFNSSCVSINSKPPLIILNSTNQINFFLEDNIFKEYGGVWITKFTTCQWFGFNNFEQIKTVIFEPYSTIKIMNSFVMKNGLFILPENVSILYLSSFLLCKNASFGCNFGSSIIFYGSSEISSFWNKLFIDSCISYTLDSNSFTTFDTSLYIPQHEVHENTKFSFNERKNSNKQKIDVVSSRINFTESSIIFYGNHKYSFGNKSSLQSINYFEIKQYYLNMLNKKQMITLKQSQDIVLDLNTSLIIYELPLNESISSITCYENSQLQVNLTGSINFYFSISLYDSSQFIIEKILKYLLYDWFLSYNQNLITIYQNSTIHLHSVNIFNSTILFNDKSQVIVMPSTYYINCILNVTSTLIGYPLLSFYDYNETNDFNIILKYDGSSCIDVISFNTAYNSEQFSNENYIALSNNKLIRYCPNIINNEVHCKLNGSIWNIELVDENNNFIFTSPHCPCNLDPITDCYIHPETNYLKLTCMNINITFDDILDTIELVDSCDAYQTITGSFKYIQFPNNLVLIDYSYLSNTNNKTTLIDTTTITTSKYYLFTHSISNSSIQVNFLNINNSLEYTIITDSSVVEFISNDLISLLPNDGLFIFSQNYYNITFEFLQETILIFQNGVILDSNKICYFGLISDFSFKCLGIERIICPDNYFALNTSYCEKCPDNCIHCFSSNECIQCNNNYYLTNGICIEKNSNCLIVVSNYCLKCSNGLYSNGTCYDCESNCVSCYTDNCYICSNTLHLNNSCYSNFYGAILYSNYGIIQCDNEYYLNQNVCQLCSNLFNNCLLCDSKHCIKCENGYILNDEYSCSSLHYNLNDSKFCEENYFKDENGYCYQKINNCLISVNGVCVEYDDINLMNNNSLFTLLYCEIYSTFGCLRCKNGYYLSENNNCLECSSNCVTCLKTSSTCLSCNHSTYLKNYNCIVNDELINSCYIYTASGGCAQCNDGYYRDGLSCTECMKECSTCITNTSCLICNETNYMTYDGICLPKSSINGCAVEISTTDGCTSCNVGYYNENKNCYKCNSNCTSCMYLNRCTSCIKDYILINEECINYQEIDNCKEVTDSKCTKCSFWYTPNLDKTGCNKHVVWWVIVIMIIIILFVGIIMGLIFYFLTKIVVEHHFRKRQNKNANIFLIKNSDIVFTKSLDSSIVVDKTNINFDQKEIGVNKETRDLICVGNISNKKIKVQFSVKKGCDKYEIRTNPQLITIPKGKACEFEILVKPLCTCKINDQIMLISVDFKQSKTVTTPIQVNTITIMTTRLDYSELIEEDKLGEGSFGIVYKGTFRGNQVAIKKLKEIQDNKDSMEEFNKEVSMLDKFRNDYIVHFYGAVFIPNKICMVTEFAQYGSLQDLMNKRKDEPIDNTMKIKILLDCSKGISYLHSNGILHRDIKPDNFLIFSLDSCDKVNSKLTDFGSSRNINMLMTNMTFTKNIGTPVYMSPEVLTNKKYKKSADIYSFAITIYETMIWEKAYSEENFVYKWDIADFVTTGKRLPKPNTMNDTIYSLIDNCWSQIPTERYKIEDVIKELEEMK
ncbi:Protein serine/threonine kinase [Entamoeba marina]